MASPFPFLKELGLDQGVTGAAAGRFLALETRASSSFNPTTGAPIAVIPRADADATEKVVVGAERALHRWRRVPAAHRGEFVRLLGEALRAHHQALAQLLALEVGLPLKVASQEVQRAIDLADFAHGLARSLAGRSLPPETGGQRVLETWQPRGVVAVITAHTSPLAAWARHAMVAWAAGNTVVWSGSEHAPLAAMAVQRMAHQALEAAGLPRGTSGLLLGPVADTAEKLVADPRLPVIAFQGAGEIALQVAQTVAARGGRAVLEAGGSNALVVLADADLDQAIPALLRAAFERAGQNRGSARRVIVEAAVHAAFIDRLVAGCQALRIGDPLQGDTEMGPLISQAAVLAALEAVETAKKQGGRLLLGGNRHQVGTKPRGFFMEPTVVGVETRGDADVPVTRSELRGPILFVQEAADRDQAIELALAAPRPPRAAVFTQDLQAAERFLTACDARSAAVNTVAPGALDVASDAWKGYMQRQLITIHHAAR